ncbi:MAG: aldo/keto reductase [Treponema sp.]|nr:aldo/keto reductase [Treponema sp.]
MIYRDFNGNKISQLAFGTMRLPVINGDAENIDQDAVEKMVKLAFDGGVNYFDTAWGYHNGKSEVAIGKALKKYDRNSYFIADKFPGYDLNNINKVEEIFAQQLERTGLDYFDFYHIHNVHELNVDYYLDPKYRIYDYLTKMKEEGKIKHLGFSTHARFDTFMKFLNKYGDHMEFCQIQLNYLDYEFQEARLKVEECNKRGIPVMVMEPLRGGRLSNLSETELAVVKKLRPEASATEMAFRWLQTIPGILTILSGMSNPDQMADNVATFQSDKPLTSDEMKAIADLASAMTNPKIQPCTSCRYCTSHCPNEIDIPLMMSLYNEAMVTGADWRQMMALNAIDKSKWPNACAGCGACEAVCPQSLKIPQVMEDLTKMLKL